METHRRKADGRRIFTPQVKQEQVARLGRQELTVAELACELAMAPQLIRRPQRPRGSDRRAHGPAIPDVPRGSAGGHDQCRGPSSNLLRGKME